MSQDPQQPSPEEASPIPKKRKRRWWLRILLILIVLVIGLVLLGPTIASTGIVRSIVVGKINDNLNGRVEIASWSLGWFSPITASGIKVYDDKNELVLDVERARLGLTLLDAIRSNFALGNDNVVDVNSFLVHVDETGETNLHRLPKPRSNPRTPPPNEPTRLPNLSGTITVNFKGQIRGPGQFPVEVDPSTATVVITDINKPIENHVKLAYHIGQGGPSSTIETSGSIGAIEQNILDITKLAAGQKINFNNVTLAAIEPFLKSMGADTHLAGTLGGGIELNTKGTSGLSANGTITINQLAFGGGPLGQDTFQTQQVSIPVNITRTTGADGKSQIKFENVGLKTDQGTVNVTGQVAEQALINLSENKAPKSDGSISIAADIPNIATIVNPLSHTFHLVQGVQLTSGSFHQQITMVIKDDRVIFSQNLKADAKGTRNGQEIKLQPIAFDASVSALPNGNALPDIRDLKMALETVFAKINGGGESLEKTSIVGNFDLGKLTTELSQFSDMNGLNLQGTGDFNVKASGDFADAKSPINLQTQANLKDLNVGGGTTSGQLNGTLVIARAEQKTNFNGQITGLTVLSAGTSIINNEQITLSFNKDPQSASGSIASSFVSANLKNAKLAPNSSGMDMLQSADLDAQVPDLHKLWALKNSFTPTTAPAGADQVQIASGSATAHLNIARDAASKITTVNVTDTNINRLAISRGTQQYAFDAATPISFKLSAAITTGDTIESIHVKELSGDMRIATLSMPEAINITGLQTNQPSYKGAIALAGKIENITPLLAILQGGPPMPYSGSFQVSQKLSPVGTAVKLVGSVDVNDFRVLAENRRDVLVTEPQVAIRNDVNVDYGRKVVSVTSLTMDMPRSQAVKLAFVGGINFWEDRRQIREGTKLDVTYDLEKLRTIAWPMLSPETQASFKDLKITGKHQETFTFSGAMPAAPTFAQSLKSLNANGAFAIDLLDTSGLTIQKFSPQIAMKGGIVTISGTPAVANDGTFDISGIVVNLAQADPIVTVPRNKRVLANVKLNPLLAHPLGNFASLLFADATEASGLINFSVLECNQVPITELTKKQSKAVAKVQFSVRELHLDSPVVGVIGSQLGFGREGLRGSIPDTTVSVANGISTSDLTVLIAREVNTRAGRSMKDVPLRFKGGMGLEDYKLHDFSVLVPKELIPDQAINLIPANFRNLVPEVVTVPLTGTAQKPGFDLGKAITTNAPGNLLKGGDGQNPLGNVNDLLKQFGGDRSNREQSQPRQRNSNP